MKNTIVLAFIAAFAVAALPLRGQRFNGFNRTEQEEPQKRSLTFSGGSDTKTLEVDTIHGSIDVAGYDGRTVEMVTKRTIRADSDDRIRAAKAEVKLDVSENSDIIRINVDDPTSDRFNRSQTRTSRIDPGYEVTIDFELRVPRQTRLHLNTINGHIAVKDVKGDFTIEGINGAIDLVDVSGSGRAHTLNGVVRAIFSASPKSNSYFGSLNGDVDITFPRDMSADIRFKSFNGGVYTDFPINPLPTAMTQEIRGQRIITKNEFSSARIGGGGPTLEFDGFNGDVRIRQAK